MSGEDITDNNNPFEDSALSRSKKIEKWLEQERELLDSLKKRGIRVSYADPRIEYRSVRRGMPASQYWSALADYENDCKQDRAALITLQKVLSQKQHALLGMEVVITPREHIEGGKSIMVGTSPRNIHIAYDISSEELEEYCNALFTREAEDSRQLQAFRGQQDAELQSFFTNMPVTFPEGESRQTVSCMRELRKALLAAFGKQHDFLHGYEFVFTRHTPFIVEKGEGEVKGKIHLPYDFNASELKRVLGRLKKGLA